MKGAGERALVEAAQSGSEAAVEELFRLHWPHTHRAAYLIVRDAAAAEDIAQEAFLSALSSLDRFDRRRPFAPWLHRIAVNRAIDWSRARSVRARGRGERRCDRRRPAPQRPPTRPGETGRSRRRWPSSRPSTGPS